MNCRRPDRVVAGHLVAGIDDDCGHLVEGTGFVECSNMGIGFEEGVDFGVSIDFVADLGADIGFDFGADIDLVVGIGASFDQGNDSDFVADLDVNFGFDSDRPKMDTVQNVLLMLVQLVQQNGHPSHLPH